MKLVLLFSIFAMSLAFASCDDDSGNNSSTNNVNNTSNTNNTNAGEFKGPCLEGGLCNGELLCVDGICEADADHDGYTTANDCDDTNESIFPGEYAPCANEWLCKTDGTYSTCTASTDCSCTTAGETREEPCGNCGIQIQTCSADLVWERTGECTNEGQCTPGAADTVTCERCGTQQLRCSDNCNWAPDSACEEQKACDPGETALFTDDCSPLGYLREETCSAQCEWEESMACSDGCLLTPRAGGTWTDGTPDFKDEVCIPGGPFIMGYDLDEQTINPEHTVYMTPYFMDVYKVTNDRYRECVTAGVCTVPTVSAYTTYPDLSKGTYPVTGVTGSQAQEFCAWDGGRALPTEAQWEKGAKGPYPRNNKYPWDGSEINCDLANGLDCWGTLSTDGEVIAVDENPLGASHYALHQMLGNTVEFISDGFDESAYLTLPILDPYTPFVAAGICRGGGAFVFYSDVRFNISYREDANFEVASPSKGFRCARGGY